MPRKTFDVFQFVQHTNKVLASSTTEPGIRQGLINAAEFVLMETGNYRGFAYLYQDEVPAGHLPGIIFDESPAHEHQYPDVTRVRFFL
jgi:hypothetical protein